MSVGGLEPRLEDRCTGPKHKHAARSEVELYSLL